MMLYTFVKDPSGLVLRVGAECSVPEELQAVMLPYSEKGCQMGEAAEFDAQLLKGAANTGEPKVEGPGMCTDGSTEIAGESALEDSKLPEAEKVAE